MKLIIAGSRTLQVSQEEIFELITYHGLHPTEIVSGTAQGVDACGENFALKAYLPVKRFPADWDQHGKSAGPKRNSQMAEYADALLLIWDGDSKGSANMKSQMKKLGKPVYEAIVRKSNHDILFSPYEPKNQVKTDDPYKFLADKVEYVKSQGQTRDHHCHWPGCTEKVPPAKWGCKQHWFKLPKRLRDRIWATYKPGQEINMSPSRAYILVAREVQEWIQENKK